MSNKANWGVSFPPRMLFSERSPQDLAICRARQIGNEVHGTRAFVAGQMLAGVGDDFLFAGDLPGASSTYAAMMVLSGPTSSPITAQSATAG